MPIIIPAKNKKRFDPQLQPISGIRGSCMLCEKFGDLTNSHVLPKSIGNTGKFRAFGYGTTSSGQIETVAHRAFANGISFRTLCRDCNSSLGGNEDQVVTNFFAQAKKAMKPSPLIVADPYLIKTRPNRLFRAVLASFAAANDAGYRARLDKDTTRIFRDEVKLRDSDLRVYYWPYSGPWFTVIRDVAVTRSFLKDPFWLNVIKFKPIGFAVTDTKSLEGMSCLNNYLSENLEEEVSIPFWRQQRENDIHWPANPGRNGAVLFSSQSISFVAAANWRNIRTESR